jgi:hypothetical protein
MVRALASMDKSGRVSLAVLILIAVFSILRMKFYGDPALSIAGNDTLSYVDSSQAPLFSAEILTGRRLLTTNLIYKLLEPESGYEITVNGSLETTRRAYQPGFDRIAILQTGLSILGWGLLAWFLAESLRSGWAKIACALLIPAFAFTPQVADWDSILLSESLTFSFFALQLALLVKLAFTLYRTPDANPFGWAAAWGVVSFFWTFLRDTNAFTSIMTVMMIGASMILPRYRRNKTLKAVMVYQVLVIALALVTARMSARALDQVDNMYFDEVFPNPSMIAIFQEMGMPADSFHDPEFAPWFQEHGVATMFRFMFDHPGYVAQKLARDFPHAFNEIKQTYFSARDLNPIRNILFGLGDALHPENLAPFLASLISLSGIIALAVRNVQNSRAWAWLGLWLFLSATLTMIPTILGDTWALNRHALYSTLIYRLSLWLFPIILVDLAWREDSATP